MYPSVGVEKWLTRNRRVDFQTELSKLRRVSGVDPALFRQLGVPPSASATEIRQAYRSALRRLHPDAVDGSGSVSELGSVVRAYRKLERAGATRVVRTVDPQQRPTIDVYA
jgi:hypothetical protein